MARQSSMAQPGEPACELKLADGSRCRRRQELEAVWELHGQTVQRRRVCKLHGQMLGGRPRRDAPTAVRAIPGTSAWT
jgi:hypothetical protein